MTTDLRWVIDQRGQVLARLLEQMGVDPAAVSDGRVFVQRRRVSASELSQELRPGDEVCVYRERSAIELHILGERNGVLAVLKPAGISTQPDHRGIGASLLGELARHTGQPAASLHALHRLDREVSGIVLVAHEPGGSSWVEAARAQGQFQRRYQAIASQRPEPDLGEWCQPIGRGDRPGLRRVAGSKAQVARTRYQVVRSVPASGGPCLLIAEPVTGRTHQIRVHAAHAGAALLGDADYGGSRRIVMGNGAVQDTNRIALHAMLVEVRPQHGAPWRIVAPTPSELLTVWTLVGGSASDFVALGDRPWL